MTPDSLAAIDTILKFLYKLEKTPEGPLQPARAGEGVNVLTIALHMTLNLCKGMISQRLPGANANSSWLSGWHRLAFLGYMI